MATLTVSPSSHAFDSYHGLAAFPHHHQQLPHYHNPFDAFASRHHSGNKSPSSAASWRRSESADPTPTIAIRPTPKYRRGAPSHSRTPSTSSEASNGSWRDRSRSPAVATVELQPAAAQQPKPKGKLISSHWLFWGCDLKLITFRVYSTSLLH